MPPPIPSGVLFTYNGFEFPVNVKTKVTEEPVMSGDERQVKYSKITISVSGYITQDEVDDYGESLFDDPTGPGDTLDAFMLYMRQSLQVNGKRLQYVNKGFGKTLDIDPAGSGIRDVAMGPKAGKLMWWSMGGAPDGCHGAGFSWEVSTCIAECEEFSNSPASNVFLEVSYSVAYACDEAGIVTITTTGKAQIPLSLRPGGVLSNNIDESIALIIKPPPDGFIRTVSRNIGVDRANCTFTITDKQLEVVYPPGVVHIEMRQRIRQEKDYSPCWIGTISGTVRLDPAASKELAFSTFMNLASYRISIARVRTYSPPGGAAGLYGRSNVMMTRVEMEEDLFKNESRFTVSYRMVNAPFNSVARLSGMWSPFLANQTLQHPPGDFYRPWSANQWSTSLRGTAQATKGLLGASFDTTSDIVIDVCNAPAAIATGNVGASSGTTAGGDYTEDAPASVSVAGVQDDADGPPISLAVLGVQDDQFDQFDPLTTWIAWYCTPTRITDYNQIRHKPLSGSVSMTAPTVDPTGLASDAATDISDPTIGWNASTPDIIQQTASPSLMVRLTGYGVRLAYRVNPPKLISYGGRDAVLQFEQVSETTMAAQDAPVYRTDWVLDYLIASAPTSVPLLSNPMLATDGGTEKDPISLLPSPPDGLTLMNPLQG